MFFVFMFSLLELIIEILIIENFFFFFVKYFLIFFYYFFCYLKKINLLFLIEEFKLINSVEIVFEKSIFSYILFQLL